MAESPEKMTQPFDQEKPAHIEKIERGTQFKSPSAEVIRLPVDFVASENTDLPLAEEDTEVTLTSIKGDEEKDLGFLGHFSKSAKRTGAVAGAAIVLGVPLAAAWRDSASESAHHHDIQKQEHKLDSEQR